MKVVLIIVGIAVLVLSSLIGGGYYWFDKNKKEYMQTMQRYQAIGNEFGGNKQQSNCMTGLMDQMAKCEGIMRCQFASVGFIRGCMSVATRDNFCDSVPKPDDFMQTVSWTMTRCQAQSLDDDRCQRYIRGFVEFCAEQHSATGADEEAPATGSDKQIGR